VCSVLRVALVVVAAVTVVVLGTLAFRWKELELAGAPTTKPNVLKLQAAVLQLWADGFTGCPTVQQVLENYRAAGVVALEVTAAVRASASVGKVE
jgi:hypothetical protein